MALVRKTRDRIQDVKLTTLNEEEDRSNKSFERPSTNPLL